MMVPENFLNRYFYFRNFLADLFKKDIFLVRGYKGTGKTLIYNALQNGAFTKKLAEVYKIHGNYTFLNIVTYNNYPNLASNAYNPANLELSAANYYKRFWVIYVWNELLTRANLPYLSKIPTMTITNEETARENIERLMWIPNFREIEKDLNALDKLLKAQARKLVISFDYLDEIVDLETLTKPSNALKELIDWCRTIPYTHIYPKMFIRTDLYEKIQGNVNKKGLESKVLSLEWSADELFAYFFKIVYAKANDKFISWLLSNNKSNDEAYILSIKQLLEANHGQITLDNKDILFFLVNHFFGQELSISNINNGKTYYWFYENLKSANNYISLRPFIALLEKAITDATKDAAFMQDQTKPLLEGTFFAHSAVREYAARKHFEDIAAEKDGLLQMFAETMRRADKAVDSFRFMTLDVDRLKHLIVKIYELNGDFAERHDKWKPMMEKLEEAGIIHQTDRTTYSFAFLYKFYFHLRGGSPARRKGT